MVMVVTVLFAARRAGVPPRFFGSGAVFYLAVASLVVPSILVSLGIGLVFQHHGLGAGLVHLRPSART